MLCCASQNMPFVKEAEEVDDSENPALRYKDRQKLLPQTADEESAKCGLGFLKRGWFWACVITIAAVCTAAPIGVRVTRELNAPNMNTPHYKFTPVQGEAAAYATPTFNAALPDYMPTCGELGPLMPMVNFLLGQPPAPVQLQNASIVTATDNKVVNLHGISWPGFNTPATMLDGLTRQQQPTWEGSDLATVARQLRLLGFNAVRLPFTFAVLYDTPAANVSRPCAGPAPSQQQLAKRTTPPKPAAKAANSSKSSSSSVVPEFVAPEGYGSNGCNGYVPAGGSTLTRFVWVVNYLVSNGFYVVLAHHPGSQGEPALASATTYANNWARLWTSFTCLPTFEAALNGRMFLDLLNEPDAVGLTWAGSKGGSAATLGDHYLAAMEKIEQQTPGLALFFVQGGGQGGLGVSWGDGFATDKALVQKLKLADASPFFQHLQEKPFGERTVLAPHAYGPTVTSNPQLGPPQWSAYNSSWSHLQRGDFCSSGTAAVTAACIKFPVVIGEMGSLLKDTGDQQFYSNLAKYMKSQPPTAAFKPVAFNSWFWWSYAETDKRVGGLVAGDGVTLDWGKLSWLQKNLGLTPSSS